MHDNDDFELMHGLPLDTTFEDTWLLRDTSHEVSVESCGESLRDGVDRFRSNIVTFNERCLQETLVDSSSSGIDPIITIVGFLKAISQSRGLEHECTEAERDPQ